MGSLDSDGWTCWQTVLVRAYCLLNIKQACDMVIVQRVCQNGDNDSCIYSWHCGRCGVIIFLIKSNWVTKSHKGENCYSPYAYIKCTSGQYFSLFLLFCYQSRCFSSAIHTGRQLKHSKTEICVLILMYVHLHATCIWTLSWITVSLMGCSHIQALSVPY